MYILKPYISEVLQICSHAGETTVSRYRMLPGCVVEDRKFLICSEW